MDPGVIGHDEMSTVNYYLLEVVLLSLNSLYRVFLGERLLCLPPEDLPGGDGLFGHRHRHSIRICQEEQVLE